MSYPSSGFLEESKLDWICCVFSFPVFLRDALASQINVFQRVGWGKRRWWPLLVHAAAFLTILSLPDSDKVRLTETAQVIEVSTAAIYQAICEHKDDKLFHCFNQFSTISGSRMSGGWNRTMPSIIHPFFRAVELRPKWPLRRQSRKK